MNDALRDNFRQKFIHFSLFQLNKGTYLFFIVSNFFIAIVVSFINYRMLGFETFFIVYRRLKDCFIVIANKEKSNQPRSPKNVFYLVTMIVNDLLQSLGRPKMFFIWSLWSSMISYKASVAQIYVLLRFSDRQWSLTMPRSPKYVSYLDSMIVNDLLQSLGRPKMFFIWSLWSSMISYKSSVAQQMFLFGHYDRQWSITKPRLPKNVFYLISMIVNDLLQSIGRPNMCLI